MQNQLKTNNSADQLNHMPAEAIGSENMPAPIDVPATMVIPRISGGERRLVSLTSITRPWGLGSPTLANSLC